jgi:serine/threonine protein kinase
MSLFGSFGKKDPGNTRNASAPGRWQVGDKIANRYEIYQILGGEGKSGMGIVYICYDHQHKTPYALKTFQEQYLFSEESQRLFEREALIWTHLERYPYIVRAMWVERLEGRLFIILEYIAPDQQRRNNLTHYLGNLTLPEILKFSIQFCYGMEYAYSRGIDCHRDIKPDNIMITSDKTAKITDFGLTKAFQEMEIKEDIISAEKRPGLSIFQTKQGKRGCGTLQYMAPEQFDGYADKRSDIYSFGITLYEMVTGGQLPFIGKGRTDEELQQDYERLHRYGEIPPLSSSLFPIIQKCLEKDPDKRYQDFISLREQLQQFLLKETGERITPPKKEELEAWEWYNKGFALANLGKYNEAIFCCDKALQINPRNAEAWNNKGFALDDLGKHNEAISCYDEALRIDPRNATVWYNKGNALRGLGKSQKAITCYDEALRINPRNAEAWNNKGFALGNLGKYNEEISCYDEALRINPRNAEAWNNKGIVLRNLGRYEEEIECYDKALEINPRYAEAWYNKGVALRKLGRNEEAIRCFEKFIEFAPPQYTSYVERAEQIINQLGRR